MFVWLWLSPPCPQSLARAIAQHNAGAASPLAGFWGAPALGKGTLRGVMPSAGGFGAVSSIRLQRDIEGGGGALCPAVLPRPRHISAGSDCLHPEIASPRVPRPRRAISSDCCGRVPPPVTVSPGGTATSCPPRCSGHICLPCTSLAPCRSGCASVGPGGAFLCAPFLLAPSPAASPEISQGCLGTGAVATFWGDDGAAAGAAVLRGAAPAPHTRASPGSPHHLRGTRRQLFRFRPGFPHERGKVGRHRVSGSSTAHTRRP